MIEVRSVSKSFGTQRVLNQLSFSIPQGETTAIVGPSGVGKSVLLKLIMGILQPDSGEIFVFGENITTAKNEAEKNKIRESLGVLFQAAALFDSLTVYENVAFPLRARGLTDKLHQKVVSMLESLSLESYAERYPEEISIGIRKRVGLARALITQPKIVLFDEPNTGLDPLDGQEVYDLIKLAKKNWGVTGVVISHELPEVFQVSERVIMLLNGGIVASGTPAEFISSENLVLQQFLHGRVHGPIAIQ